MKVKLNPAFFMNQLEIYMLIAIVNSHYECYMISKHSKHDVIITI